MVKVYENIVIGGGASGLMFAANIKEKQNTLILEHNLELGAKILISGGGRCNFTNKEVSEKDYLGNSTFIKEILASNSRKSLLKWFTSRDLHYSIKNNKEYFCKSSANELLNILKREIRGVKAELNCNVQGVTKSDELFKVTTNKGDFFAKRVIVASGGLSFPKLGAGSIGFDIAKSMGHSITPLSPALVGFTLQAQESYFKSLSGTSIDIVMRLANREFRGSFLFTHKGVSGPVVLNASLFWQKGYITIDFLPDFSFKNIKNSNKTISNLLPLPKRVAKAFLQNLNIEDKSANRIDKKGWQKLETLKEYTFAPAGNFGYGKAEVTKGGVNTDEIERRTLMSKRVKNLFFLGEVLDVTGRLGGYNFHWAFSSAKVCAEYLNTINR